MGTNSSIVDILRVQMFSTLPPASQDKQLAFVEDDLVIYAYNAQGGNAGHLGTNWFVVGASVPFGGFMIFVTPGTNNKATDAATFGADWPNGDESFTIQDGIAAAEAFGGGTVFGIGTGFVINNPVRNNQIMMRPNVKVKWGSVGTRVRTRDTGVDSVEPLGGVVMFTHPDLWDGAVGFTSLDLDPAGKPGDGSEDGMYISRLELIAGEVALKSVVVGGMIVYAGRTRRLAAITGDTVMFDSPVAVSDTTGAPLSADYLSPTYVIQNSSIGDFCLYISNNTWVSTYYGIILGYGAYWCEIGEIKYCGTEISTAFPATNNLPVEGGFITAYNCYDWRIKDILTENYPFKTWSASNCDSFEFLSARFSTTPSPSGFDATSPAYCFTMTACDDWHIDDVAISVMSYGPTAGEQIGYCVGTGLEKILVTRTCRFYQAGFDAGAPVIFGGVIFENMSSVECTADIIAGGDPATDPTKNTVSFFKILKAKLGGRIRAAGHLAKEVPATVRHSVTIIKTDYVTTLTDLAYYEGADEVAAPGASEAPLYLFLTGGTIRILDADFHKITLDKVGVNVPEVYIEGGKSGIFSLATKDILVYPKASFYSSLSKLFARNVQIVLDTLPCTLAGLYNHCIITWPGPGGGTLTLAATMENCLLTAEDEITLLIISSGDYLSLDTSAAGASLLETQISGAHIIGGKFTQLTLMDTNGIAEDAEVSVRDTAGNLSISDFNMRGGKLIGGTFGGGSIIDMASGAEIREVKLTGEFDVTVGGAGRTGVYLMECYLNGTGIVTVPALAETQTWVKDNHIGTMTFSNLSGIAQAESNV